MLKWILISLAAVGALSAVLLAREVLVSKPIPSLLHAPAQIPFEKSIAGAGIIEPASESIAIGVSEPGLVMNVFVQEGQHVNAGDALFKIDTRGIEGDVLTAH